MSMIFTFPEFPPRRRTGFSPLSCFAVRDGENGGGGGEIPRAHVWRPIEDMPAEFDERARAAEAEMRELAGKWEKRKAEIDPAELEQFNRELNREWAIETGLIEFAYLLERGTTQLLIERGFVEGLIPHRHGQHPAEVIAMLSDHSNVLAALFDFADGGRELSVGYVKQLHAEMLRNQETVVGVDQFGNKTRVPMNHGVFKMRPNNPHTPDGKLHEYCPWEQTASEMDRLIEMNKTHSAHPPLARAAWLHHRFVQIHPFEDGNGRVARCLASLVLIRAGLFPLVVVNEDRGEYLDALDEANRGDLSPLICGFAKWQKRSYFKTARSEQVAEAKRTVLAVRDIPSDSVENVLSKIKMARWLVLRGDEFMRAKDAGFFNEEHSVGDDIAKLEKARRIVKKLDADSSEKDPAARDKTLSDSGELAVRMAEEGMFRILFCHRN